MNSQRQKIPVHWTVEAKPEGLTIRHIGSNNNVVPFSLQLEEIYQIALLAKFPGSKSQPAELTTGPKLIGAMILRRFFIENCRTSKINTQPGHRRKSICQDSKNFGGSTYPVMLV